MLVKDRRPFPIEVKSRLERPEPPPGLVAFCRRYPSVRTTFTVSRDAFAPLEVEGTLHRFVRFEDVPQVVQTVRSA